MKLNKNKNKIVHISVIIIFTILYFLTSIISTIHVVDFFEMTNPFWLSVLLAIGFELGAAASLASLTILDKINKPLIWALFITLTLFQAMGNMYYAYVHVRDFQGWIELFGLIEKSEIFQKRILATVSGAILPLVALGYIKSLVDYIRPSKKKKRKRIKKDGFYELFESKPKKKALNETEEKVEIKTEKAKEPVEKKEELKENNVIMIEPKLKNAEESSSRLPKTAENENKITNTAPKQKSKPIITTKKNPRQ